MYLTENLNTTHNKEKFSCGKDLLDIYIKKQATQDIKRKLAACFVLKEKETNYIKGYYTLSNSSIHFDNLPLTLIGRLAVDKIYQGQGIGKILLVDALRRSYELSKQIGSFAVIVDPLDKDAELFYLKYGFIKLPDSGKMFLTMKTIDQLFM